MLDQISQFGIAILGPLSIILIGRKNRWGFVCGLACQPFWFITSYLHEQWGIFGIAILYSGIWAYGIYQWFGKKEKALSTPTHQE